MKTILVDTSTWIEYFKGNIKALDVINNTDHNSILIAGPIIAELIQGLKSGPEKELFTTVITGLPSLEMTNQDWIISGELGNQLRSIGITVPLIDLVIFNLARKNKCALLTLNNHFEVINESADMQVELLSL